MKCLKWCLYFGGGLYRYLPVLVMPQKEHGATIKSLRSHNDLHMSACGLMMGSSLPWILSSPNFWALPTPSSVPSPMAVRLLCLRVEGSWLQVSPVAEYRESHLRRSLVSAELTAYPSPKHYKLKGRLSHLEISSQYRVENLKWEGLLQVRVGRSWSDCRKEGPPVPSVPECSSPWDWEASFSANGFKSGGSCSS